MPRSNRSDDLERYHPLIARATTTLQADGYRFEGQHYAFFTPTAESLQQFREAVAREGGKVDALEQTQVRSATAHGLYFTDFDGNPLQLQVEGSE
jgi:catechol-2,3-dioxygenase